MAKASMNLNYRIEALKQRQRLIEDFEELGLKQADVVTRSGQLKGNVSDWFNGRNDSRHVEPVVREMVCEARQGIGA